MSMPVDPGNQAGSPEPESGPPSRGVETALRWSIVGLLMFMVIGLSFGLGFGTHLLLDKDAGTDGASATRGQFKDDGSPNFAVLDEIFKVLKQNYVEPDRIDPELIRTGAIDGLINAVGDTHQVYIAKVPPDFDDDFAGQFEGIGCNVERKNAEIVCTLPLEDSPAKKAGMKPGDVILAVDGESIKGISVQEAQRKIRGPAGSTVKLQVRHPDGKSEEVSITRDKILRNSVKPGQAQDAAGNPVNDVAYVRIEQFTRRTPVELKDYLRSIQGQGHKGIIIDLRNNPGGLLDSVVDVASQFMSNQTILIERMRDGSEKRYTTKSGGVAVDPSLKMAVLVNHNSASAAELLAGALRDNGRGTLLGESTFGKGTVNLFFDLKTDGGKLYVTIANWLTPKRDLIEGKGVKPDIEVHASDDENPLDYYNAVMYRAVDLLRNGS